MYHHSAVTMKKIMMIDGQEVIIESVEFREFS